MVGVRDGIAVLLVATFCLTVFAVGTVGAQDNETIGDGVDEIDALEIDAETECLSGAGESFTVGSDDGTNIWIRLHALELTDSGGSFGVELTGSSSEDRVIEVVVGLEHVGGGVLDTITSPISSYELVGGFDFQLSIFDDATPDINGDDETPGFDGNDEPENESTDDGAEESERDRDAASDDGPFELLEC